MAAVKKKAGVRRGRTTKGAFAATEQEGARAAAERRAAISARAAARAARAFEGFTVSKYRAGAAPATHVAAGDSTADVQRTVVKKGLQRLAQVEGSGGLTLSLRPDLLDALPSYDPAAGTVEVADVMSLFTRYMKGNEFYSQGHPMEARLDLQAQARALIAAAIQKGGAR